MILPRASIHLNQALGPPKCVPSPNALSHGRLSRFRIVAHSCAQQNTHTTLRRTCSKGPHIPYPRGPQICRKSVTLAHLKATLLQ